MNERMQEVYRLIAQGLAAPTYKGLNIGEEQLTALDAELRGMRSLLQRVLSDNDSWTLHPSLRVDIARVLHESQPI